jgi:hypothetical protein
VKGVVHLCLVVGVGAFGEVFTGMNIQTREVIAIKVLVLATLNVDVSDAPTDCL